MDNILLIDPWALLFGALLLLTLPTKWLFCALLAALVHELWHICSLIALHGKIYKIHIRIGGAVIDAHAPSRFREIISILAGPLGSFFLAVFLHSYPEIAVCGMVQGLFNLLPIYPLDGGRILRCILEIYIPDKAASIQKWVQGIVILLLAVFIVRILWMN